VASWIFQILVMTENSAIHHAVQVINIILLYHVYLEETYTWWQGKDKNMKTLAIWL